jgi:hypothetical protein
LKLAFILVEIVLAIAFAACNFRKLYNAAAVLEWAVSFIFTFYIFSFFIDLLPAAHTKHSHAKFGAGPQVTQMQMEENDQYAQENVSAGHAGRNTAESQRTLGANDVRTVNGVKYENSQAPVASNF